MANWQMTIDISKVFHDDEMSFEAKRDRIVAEIELSMWREITDSPLTLDTVIAHLGVAQDEVHFNQIWSHVCDLANADKVWLQTF
jgi:hypothetical protein